MVGNTIYCLCLNSRKIRLVEDIDLTKCCSRFVWNNFFLLSEGIITLFISPKFSVTRGCPQSLRPVCFSSGPFPVPFSPFSPCTPLSHPLHPRLCVCRLHPENRKIGDCCLIWSLTKTQPLVFHFIYFFFIYFGVGTRHHLVHLYIKI